MGREDKCIIYENQRYYGPMGWCAHFQELSLAGQKKKMDSFLEVGTIALKHGAAL
jgi:hypothetical protein